MKRECKIKISKNQIKEKIINKIDYNYATYIIELFELKKKRYFVNS